MGALTQLRHTQVQSARPGSRFAVPAAIAPGLSPVTPFTAARTDQALDLVLHQRLEHSFRHSAEKVTFVVLCSSSIRGMLVSVIGVSIGPWVKSANSTTTDTLDGRPRYTDSPVPNSTTPSETNSQTRMSRL